MLDAQQVAQFRSFGFVVLKDLFSQEEVAVMRREFDHAAERDGRIEPFNGTKGQNFSMMGEDTPFYSSLPEDPRFLESARQLFGEDVFAIEVNSYRYVGNTSWHFNDGAPNLHGYGPKYQFPLGPVRGDTGALRFIPGSHKDPRQGELARYEPISRRSSKSEQAMRVMDQVPCCVAEADPGDAVLFDTRIFHCTWGGSDDRQASCITYYHYPENPRELEVMRNVAPSFYRSPTRWNKLQWDEWFSNPHGSAIRERWTEQWRTLAKTPQSATGLRLVYDDYGAATFEKAA